MTVSTIRPSNPAIIAKAVLLLLLSAALAQGANTQLPIKPQQISMIESLFRENGLLEAHAGIDAYGRIRLEGAYENKKAVDLAFAISQAVVGVNRVSPVIPENVKVKEWEKKIEELFKRRPKTAVKETEAPSPVTATKYALLVGVSRFKEPRISLQYAKSDAVAFYNYVTSPQGGFPKENATLLTDEEATKSNIEHALEEIEDRSTRDDLVLVYFSSHGTPPYTDGVVHVVTYDTVLSRTSAWNTSISGERIRGFIERTKAKRIVVILDTCYSSGAYRNVSGFQSVGGKSIDLFEESYGTPAALLGKSMLGSKDIVLEDDSGKGLPPSSKNPWGIVLLSASDTGEKSWESDNLKKSFFTYYLLEGLKRDGNVRDGFFYAKPRVIEGVKKEKEADQHPQVVASRPEWDIAVGAR